VCGIVAILSFKRPVSWTALRAATYALRHRGPDGQAEWISDDGRIGLGHTRLGIVDPTAVQPLVSEDGRRRLVVNGELYGFDAIRQELEARGHRLATRGDSEIALHLHEELGERCLQRLRGEFAFCLWDERAATLFAARDRFGVKPLYYARAEGALVLASEAKALFAAGVPAAWDRDQAFQALHGCYAPDYSLFRDVKQLPPGHLLRASPAGVHIEPYWSLDYPRARDEVAGETPSVDEIAALLKEAIRLRMRADVAVGYLLSGGLDSSTMLGMAAAEAGTRVRAFSISFGSKRYDESKHAKETARRAGAELTALRVFDSDMATAFADSVWHGEGIQYNGHGAARFLLSQKISGAGYRSVMGGEGADELFAGYGFVQNATLNRSSMRLRYLAMVGTLLRPKNEAERTIARTSRLLATASRIASAPTWAVSRGAEWLLHLRSVLSVDFLREFGGRDPYRVLLRELDLCRGVRGRHPARQLLYVWLRSIFANYHMAADRIDMAHAVEVRLPYLDHVLFERAKHIPVGLLTSNGQQKHLLREIGRPYVTEAVYRGPKRPFYAPPAAVAAGSRLHELVQDTLRGPTLASVPFFDRDAVVSLLDRLPSLDEASRATADPILMMLASICVLHERFRL
jgi:asparagine synthase (glutamine-hydrolysing)